MFHQAFAMIDATFALWRCGGAATLARVLAATLLPRPAGARPAGERR
ncbi:hypothetical protein [Albimonas pacifica]|uniref:Uncharacterized protein n=1 Tax=Albimonas pacifica TaxID=1114924 RepID=A0A1I3BKR5_9RHOB|nr:hypothetical protein [Albimonas pacifica]SFH62914.1 hypothetical protein SAMN05216258_101165 [Albimonas pacifica]